MTGQKRGFGRERHNAMKAAVAAVAVAGFGATWYAFAQGHPAPVGAATGAPAAAAPTPAAGGAPSALPTRRARTSRGS